MPTKICTIVFVVSFIILLWFLFTLFKKESFSESINANPKLGSKTIRGSSVYFTKNHNLNKGFLSEQKFP